MNPKMSIVNSFQILKMVRACSVIGCCSKQNKDISVFQVRDDWICLNVGGWKAVKNLTICQLHFNPSDLCNAKNGNKVVKQSGKPVFRR